MAEQRSDPVKAMNNTLTGPDQDLQVKDADYPAGTPHERVRADSGGPHAPPTYAGGPGNRLDPDADPNAATARPGELTRRSDGIRPAAEPANPTLEGQGAEGAEAARVPPSMLDDEARSNSIAGGAQPGA